MTTVDSLQTAYNAVIEKMRHIPGEPTRHCECGVAMRVEKNFREGVDMWFSNCECFAKEVKRNLGTLKIGVK